MEAVNGPHARVCYSDLWEAVSTEHEPTPDPALLPTPAFEFDPRRAW